MEVVNGWVQFVRVAPPVPIGLHHLSAMCCDVLTEVVFTRRRSEVTAVTPFSPSESAPLVSRKASKSTTTFADHKRRLSTISNGSMHWHALRSQVASGGRSFEVINYGEADLDTVPSGHHIEDECVFVDVDEGDEDDEHFLSNDHLFQLRGRDGVRRLSHSMDGTVNAGGRGDGNLVLEPLIKKPSANTVVFFDQRERSASVNQESQPEGIIHRQVSVGSKTFDVTNYRSTDLDHVSMVSTSYQNSVDSVVIDMTSSPNSPQLPHHPSANHLQRRHSLPAHILTRRGSQAPSLPAQQEENEEDQADNMNNDINANQLQRRDSSAKTSQVLFAHQADYRDSDHEGGGYQQALKNVFYDPKMPNGTVNGSHAWNSNRREVMDVARRGRLFSKRKQRRIMNKSGYCNLNFIKVEQKGLMYLSDIFTTFLEIKWRYTIMLLFLTFGSTWTIFGLIWWGLVSAHAYKEIDCVTGVHSFTTSLLFSVETMHTIGYGTRAVTDECVGAVILVMVQSIMGVMIQCVLAGIVFAKLARSKRRATTVMFSKNAVVCEENGSMYLMFRVGNMRSTQMMGTTVNAMLVKTEIDEDGELISIHQESLKVSTQADDDVYFLAWPCTVVHKIDETSPLWNYGPEQLMVADFEIIVILEAVCEATGGNTQVRTSYLPCEIQWGYSLAPLITQHHEEKKGTGKYTINFKHFHHTVPVLTPEESACNLSHFPNECKKYSHN